jgi:mevalonate kinase
LTEVSPTVAEAFGKVILVGEHAVVYGTPAIALGIGTAARASVSGAAQSSLRLGARDVVLDAEAATESATLEQRAYGALLAALGASNMAAEVQLCLPAGVGLGASAALAVAVARAVAPGAAAGAGAGARATAQSDDAARVLAAAQAWENVFHGNASGIDAAAAYYGGCLAFTRAQGTEPLTPGLPLQFVVAVAGPAASTRMMVEGVAELKRREPERVGALLEHIGRLVERARGALVAGERAALGRLMNENHEQLQALGVSTSELDRACEWARAAGAFGAKLTGGGGGGCVLALCAPDGVESVLQSFRGHGLMCFDAVVAAR